MTPADLRARAKRAREKGRMHAVALWPEQAEQLAAQLEALTQDLERARTMFVALVEHADHWPGCSIGHIVEHVHPEIRALTSQHGETS